MRGIVWLGSGVAALLLLVAAVLGLRSAAPDRSAQIAGRDRTGAARGRGPDGGNVAAELRHGHCRSPRPGGHRGRAAPGDRVKVLDGGKAIGEVTADARGEWVLVPDTPMAAGDRQLEIEATGPAGGPARRSADVVALSIAPSPSGKGASSALAVLLPRDASRPAQILQRPEPAPESGPLSLDSAEYAPGERLVLSGRADAGARVAVYAGDQPLGTVTADAAGKWLLSSGARLPSGAELRINQIGGDGAVAFDIALPFNPTGVVASAGGDTYIVRRGNSLWLIARQVYGDGSRYTAIYRANAGLIQDPDRIFPGQQFKVPKS